VVVHNGIITNYSVLKPFLVRLLLLDASCWCTAPFSTPQPPAIYTPKPPKHQYPNPNPHKPNQHKHTEQEKQGAVFVSDTDTECVPHLCEYLWKKKGGKVTLPQLVSGGCWGGVGWGWLGLGGGS